MVLLKVIVNKILGGVFMEPALFIANYIIEYSNSKQYLINNLKLQKILYFINARSLVEKGKPMFNETIQKWKFGPVVPRVYHEYKRNGASQITVDDIVQQLLEFSDDKLTINEYSAKKISNETKKLIQETVDALDRYSAFELVDKTHEHLIWKKDEDRILAGEQHISYKNDEIERFFKTNTDEQIWLTT